MSIGSWNRLEYLLNDATTKASSPKTLSISKLEEVTHPHLIRCVRHKKNLKFSRNAIGPIRSSGEVIGSCKEISANDSGMYPSKVKIGVSKTMTAIRDTPFQKSTVELEHCDEYSQEDREVSIEMNNEEYDEYEAEPETYKDNRIGSLDMELIYRDGRATEAAQRKMMELARNQSIEESKTYKPVCGIEDHHLRELYRLKCYDLKIGTFGDSEESFLQGTKKKSSGFKLCFLESGFGPRAIEKLGQIIQNNSEITQLVLRKSVLTGANIRSFARSLSNMPSLIHLELANNSMEPQDFAILFEELSNSKTLVSIDISNYEPDKKNRFTQECLPAFKKFVQGNIYIQFVTMVSLMLEDELMQEILLTVEQCPSLLSLNIASNNSTGKCLERITNVISQTSLCQLDLSHNKLRKEGAQHLAKAIQNLKGPGREGVSLVLENTHLGIDVNYIFAAFGRDTNVSKLNLGNNFLCNLEIIRLESALSENNKLLELNFSNCKLGEIGGKILALGLSKNTWLQNLILVNNDFGDSIASSIIHAVIPNHNLRQLDLSQNKLASESAKALQDLIKKNPNVEKYNLHLNKINEKEGYLLQEALYFNSKIIQFNIHHNPVKYNTIETVERIVKDNLKKLRFHAVPKLKTEVARKRVFIQDERHNVDQAIEMERVKGDVKRDVDKFQKTLTALRNRSESPTIKKNEKLIMKLGKEIKVYNVEQNDAIIEVREFGNEATLEKDMYKNEIDNIGVNIMQVSKKVDAKRIEVEDVKEKYEPEIRKLRLEISRLKKDNQFVELYNETITKKIKKEKKKIALSNHLPNPKISDIFLASSELARHKKKNTDTHDMTTNQASKSRIGVILETHSQISLSTENSKINKELNFAMRNQQFRISRVMKENEKGQPQKKKKKKEHKGDGSELDVMKQRIKEKIRNLIKVNDCPDNILGQIADNEQLAA